MNDKYLTVSAITRYLKAKFNSDDNLKLVFLKGEISNFKSHTTGHLYFSIKDENSKINAVMFKTSASKLDFKPTDGTKVLICGRISIYEPIGNYQIYVDKMTEDGVGNLYVAFEKLKKKLLDEGLFDKSHKKTIPKIPRRIGVITSSTGAAVRDIITTIKRRFPVCETILFPTLVQGENAKESIVSNLKKAPNYDLDVIIIGRGGGSIEDLWPFNEEIVARAIYDCQIPIISAVGHEVDFTISDFVSDLRAPTPTAAAELAVPNMIDLKSSLNQFSIRLKEAIYKKINFQRLYLDSVKNSFVIKTPLVMFENRKQKIDLLFERIDKLIIGKIENQKQRLQFLKESYILKKPENIYINEKAKIKTIIQQLELLNPLNVLNRGYGIVYSNESLVKSISDVKDDITVKVTDGVIEAKVTEVKHGKKI